MPRTFLTRLRTAGPYPVVGLHAAAWGVVLLQWLEFFGDWQDGMLWVAVMAPAQAMLLIMHAAANLRRAPRRAAAAGLGATVPACWFALWLREEGEFWDFAAMFFVQVAVAAVGAGLGGRLMKNGPPAASQRNPQFGIRNLLVWTTMAAVILAFVRTFYPLTRERKWFAWPELTVPATGVFTALLSLTLLWCFTRPGWSGVARAAPTTLLLIGCLAATEPLVLFQFAHELGGLIAAVLTSYTMLQGLIVLATLILWKLCGRLN